MALKKELPYYKVYSGDEEKNPAIGSLTLEEYGFYCRIRNYMANCEPYGHLKVNGKVILIDKLSVIVRVNQENAARLLNNLLDVGVVDKMADGTIYCAAMVRNDEIRRKRATGGGLGGNPALKKAADKVNLTDNLGDKQKCEHEHVYEHVGESERGAGRAEEVPPPERGAATPMPWESEDFAKSWRSWCSYMQEQHGQRYTHFAEIAAIEGLWKLVDGDEIKAIESIKFSMARRGKNIFKNDEKHNSDSKKGATGGAGGGKGGSLADLQSFKRG